MVIWKRYPIRAHAFPSAFSTRRKTSLEHILLCMILPVHPFILTFLRPFNRPTNQPINQSTNDLVPHRKARQRSTLPFFTPLPAPRTKLSQDSGRLRLRPPEKEAANSLQFDRSTLSALEKSAVDVYEGTSFQRCLRLRKVLGLRSMTVLFLKMTDALDCWLCSAGSPDSGQRQAVHETRHGIDDIERDSPHERRPFYF